MAIITKEIYRDKENEVIIELKIFGISIYKRRISKWMEFEKIKF